VRHARGDVPRGLHRVSRGLRAVFVRSPDRRIARAYPVRVPRQGETELMQPSLPTAPAQLAPVQCRRRRSPAAPYRPAHL